MKLRTIQILLATPWIGLFWSCNTEKLTTIIKAQSTVSGTIIPFASGGAEASCSAVQVKVHSIDSEGNVEFPALLETTAVQGHYSFENAAFLGVTKNTAKSPFLIQASGCGKIFARPITRALDQVLSYGSTLVSFSLGAGTAPAKQLVSVLSSSSAQQLDQLLDELNGSSDFDEAYLLLTTSTAQAELFSSLFEIAATKLAAAAPLFTVSDVGEGWSEGSSYDLEAQLFHWHSSYDPANEWLRESTLLSTLDSYSYSPGSNDQGEAVSFSLVVGANDGGGQVDRVKSIRTYTFKRDIADLSVPVVPTVTLASAPLTRRAAVDVVMDTGAALANCASFTQIGITEIETAPSATMFNSQNIKCTTAPSQVITYSLIDRTTGSKTLYFWSQDSAGSVSATPQTVVMTFDSSAPYLDFSSPAANSSHSGSVAITGTCEEPFDVIIAGGGASSSAIATCSSSAFSGTVTFTPGTGTKEITISQTNDAGTVITATRDFDAL